MEVPTEWQWLVPVLSIVATITMIALGKKFKWIGETHDTRTDIHGAAIIDSSQAMALTEAVQNLTRAHTEQVEAQLRTAQALEAISRFLVERDKRALHDELDLLRRENARLKG